MTRTAKTPRFLTSAKVSYALVHIYENGVYESTIDGGFQSIRTAAKWAGLFNERPNGPGQRAVAIEVRRAIVPKFLDEVL